MTWPTKTIKIQEAIQRIYDHGRSDKAALDAHTDDQGIEEPRIRRTDRNDKMEAHKRLSEAFDQTRLKLWAVTPAQKRGEGPDRSEVFPPPSGWQQYFQLIVMRTARTTGGKSFGKTADRLLHTEMRQIFLDATEFNAWLVDQCDGKAAVTSATAGLTAGAYPTKARRFSKTDLKKWCDALAAECKLAGNKPTVQDVVAKAQAVFGGASRDKIRAAWARARPQGWDKRGPTGPRKKSTE